jgi:hypothetical protein
MGLTFTVGNPSDAFVEPFATRVRGTLEVECEGSVVLDSAEEPYYSQELGWSGWQLLQELASDKVSPEQVPHLLSMEAWSGVYLPSWNRIGALEFDGEPTPLDVASLDSLIEELELVGRALGLATDAEGLKAIAVKYEDDDLVDSDMEIQTYAQLLLAAREAKRRKQPLWIVK